MRCKSLLQQQCNLLFLLISVCGPVRPMRSIVSSEPSRRVFTMTCGGQQQRPCDKKARTSFWNELLCPFSLAPRYRCNLLKRFGDLRSVRHCQSSQGEPFGKHTISFLCERRLQYQRNSSNPSSLCSTCMTASSTIPRMSKIDGRFSG